MDHPTTNKKQSGPAICYPDISIGSDGESGNERTVFLSTNQPYVTIVARAMMVGKNMLCIFAFSMRKWNGSFPETLLSREKP